jgi:glycosyltransferase involved in cell wall biosynthesis
MRRLLVICHGFPPYFGGAEHVAYYLAREAAADAQRPAAVTVLTSDIGGRLPPEDIVDGVAIRRVHAPKKEWTRHTTLELAAFLRAARRRLPAVFARFQPDYTLAHFSVPAGWLALDLRRRYGVPYAVVLHGSDVPGYQPGRFGWLYPLLRPAVRRVWRHAACVIAVSEQLRALARTTWPGGAIEVIANGVDTRSFQPAEGFADRPCGHPCRLLVVAQLIERKGIQHLLAALGAAEKTRNAFELHLHGTGPYEPALRSQTERLGLKGRVHFHGFTPHADLPALMRAADIFVLPSLQEGLPLALLEALACGLAVAASATGGIPAVVRDRQNGLLTRPGDSAALAAALRELSADGGLRARLRAAARRTAEGYAWNNVWAQYAGRLWPAAPA